MKRTFILSDNEEIKRKIISIAGKISDKISIVGATTSRHEAIIEVVKQKPDLIILAITDRQQKIRFFDKYKVINVCEEENNFCHAISESYIRQKLSEIENEKKMTKDKSLRLKQKINLVALGISTGGPHALKDLIPKIKKNFSVPIIVIQHMPPGFTKDMANGLKRISGHEVIEADEKMQLEKNKCYVIPGGRNMGIKHEGKEFYFYEYKQKYGFYTPSVDYMLESIAKINEINPLVAIMTGMGNDGFEGVRKIVHQNKGIIITQSKDSCVVYGMPRVIDEADLADIPNLNIDGIAEEINKRV